MKIKEKGEKKEKKDRQIEKKGSILKISWFLLGFENVLNL